MNENSPKDDCGKSQTKFDEIAAELIEDCIDTIRRGEKPYIYEYSHKFKASNKNERRQLKDILSTAIFMENVISASKVREKLPPQLSTEETHNAKIKILRNTKKL